MKAINLRTEYLKNPIGIDILNPRLMWNCEGGVTQTAYQIVTEKWDSGKIASSSMHAVYPEKLTDRERVGWKIRLWDEKGEPGDWSEASFEMGISDWGAKWITGNYRVNRKDRYPVDCFRKQFSVSDPKNARLYITACGLYEAKINGARVGNFVLAPGLTDYRVRVQYQTYDVTELLREGENVLTVSLADGWYRGSVGAWGIRNQYGTETKLLAQLENGGAIVCATDETWDWSNDGAVRFADLKDGEVIDFRKAPSYSKKAKLTSHNVTPTASNSVSVTEHERFKPAISKAPNGKWLLDFGQNMAGYARFRISAHANDKMHWRFGEMLDKEGNLTLKNIQCADKKHATPLQEIICTCREGENEYKTAFAVFGFQYAEVDTPLDMTRADVEAIAVYSDMEETGRFACSNELINKLYAATVWSTKSNHLDIPTDCPTRERHGWTGDAQIFFGTASYMFDFAAFSRKYLTDVYDWQRWDGCLPQIAPYGGVDFYMYTMNGSVGWSDIGILYPYRFRKKYGDSSILTEYYDRMVRYAEFMIRRISKDGSVKKGQSYGEWAEPADVQPNDWKDMVFPHPEVSTAYTAYVLGLMAEISDELGKSEDAAKYRSYSDKCKEAYRKMCALDTDRQALLVRPLYMGLLDEKQTEFARKRLITALENYSWRLGTGFLSTPLILDVLSEYDLEAAYRLLENEDIPGWLSMPKAGATTIWEAWEGPYGAAGGIASLNHYSKGAVCEWLFSTMCGIKVDGERHFTVAPLPGGNVTSAEASYRSVYGEVKSCWKRDGGRTVYKITVPSNCTATINLPGREPESVCAGTYTIGG
ncbi:MAG: family 78 glycoside hydrolase catalytic domain [Oscillospiraceae bacterium]|nr:family 78 glycoside hydrolase catalytic domain [Oscillospiraceae bacterium]